MTPEEFERVRRETACKKKTDFAAVEYLAIAEGLCVRCMHAGNYDSGPATVGAMHDFAAAQGYTPDITDSRPHHEIHLRTRLHVHLQ